MPRKIGFSSVTENFDTTTPIGHTMLGIMAAFAQLEREPLLSGLRMQKKKQPSKAALWVIYLPTAIPMMPQPNHLKDIRKKDITLFVNFRCNT